MSQNLEDEASEKSLMTSIKAMREVTLFDEEDLLRLKLVHAGSEDHEMLKVVREMRTRIYKERVDKNFVCLVTSVAPKGGGSFVARNLAATVTMDATKTAVLIDCNLYSPSAEALLPVSPQVGLTDYLGDEFVKADDVLYASGIARLRVVPVGNNRDGGTEKIMSSRMKQFIRDIKARYSDRIVIVDGPSVSEYDAEVRILVELCDLVILVVPDDMVTEVQVNEAIESIGKEKLFGLVLNKVKQ